MVLLPDGGLAFYNLPKDLVSLLANLVHLVFLHKLHEGEPSADSFLDADKLNRLDSRELGEVLVELLLSDSALDSPNKHRLSLGLLGHLMLLFAELSPLLAWL